MMTQSATRTRRRLPAALAIAGIAAGGMIAWTGVADATVAKGGYADLVEKVSPAVVYIEVTEEAKPTSGEAQNPFPPGSPFEQFFKRFGMPMPQQHQGPMKGVGSGFIIDAKGDIVTNNHVVQGADKVLVKLTDGRQFTAKVVGTDPMTDVALIRIKADANLPHVPFGDSAKMRVGDAVIAVGNPFGLGGTVTTGIISALSRNINAGPYDDFIQTDAAINKGNSGGPLFNEDGEVIGMNTAIFSPSGGSVGIGFAVPSDMVKSVISQIEAKGGVERGWLGVQIQTVTPEIADALGLDHAKGALVSTVTPDSPAAKAGFKQGDVILSFNGQDVSKMNELPRLVAAEKPGTKADVQVLRKGSEETLAVTLGTLNEDKMASAEQAPQMQNGNADQLHSKELGVDLAKLDDGIRSQLNLDQSATGVVVASVDPNGASADQLRPGDLLVEVDGAKVKAPADVEAQIEHNNSTTALLLVNRGGDNLFVGVRLTA